MIRLIVIGTLGGILQLSALAQTPNQFRVPDVSMEPTYQIQQAVDLIEGIKTAEVGDVVLITGPKGRYLSRILALPGDEVKFVTSTGLFSRNGKPMPMTKTGDSSPDGKQKKLQTITGKKTHSVYEGEMWNQTILAYVKIKAFEDGETTSEPSMSKKDCRVDPKEFVCRVPKGHLFVKGDNRDYAQMGFVSNTNVIGYAK